MVSSSQFGAMASFVVAGCVVEMRAGVPAVEDLDSPLLLTTTLSSMLRLISQIDLRAFEPPERTLLLELSPATVCTTFRGPAPTDGAS